jgi:hypothetical protein
MRHDRANAVDAFPSILGFAIPDAPVQPLDLGDNQRLCRYPRRMISRQGAGDLLEVLKPQNQSRIGVVVMPASARLCRRPGQPSVNAVNIVSSVHPMASSPRRITASIAVAAFATAPKTRHPPAFVST